MTPGGGSRGSAIQFSTPIINPYDEESAGRVGSIAIAIARRTTLSPAAPRARAHALGEKKKTKEKKKTESMHFSSIGVSGLRPSRRRRLDSPE